MKSPFAQWSSTAKNVNKRIRYDPARGFFRLKELTVLRRKLKLALLRNMYPTGRGGAENVTTNCLLFLVMFEQYVKRCARVRLGMTNCALREKSVLGNDRFVRLWSVLHRLWFRLYLNGSVYCSTDVGPISKVSQSTHLMKFVSIAFAKSLKRPQSH